jgi:hypothetical protein
LLSTWTAASDESTVAQSTGGGWELKAFVGYERVAEQFEAPVSDYARIHFLGGYDGMIAGVSGGYRPLQWLVLNGLFRYSFGIGSASLDYLECPNVGCRELRTFQAVWAHGVERERHDIELGLGIKALWPFEFWVNPLIDISFGLSVLYDDWFSNGSWDHFWVEGLGFFVNAGVGADFHLSRQWHLGVMVNGSYRIYPDLTWDAEYISGGMETDGLGLGASLNLSWIH